MAVRRAGMLLWACVFHALVSCSPAGVAGDIPDDVVYTDLHKLVRLGDGVVLKCQFRGTPSAVYWKKGDDPRTAPNLVSWIPGDPVTGLCEGERPCQIMEMNEDFSLIIKEVSIAEQGRYICRVSRYNEMLIHNFTDIRVFSPPKEPFPVIDECVESESSTSDSTQPCSVLTNDSMVSISCTVTNYYSDLDLFFLHGSQKIRDTATNVWINDDGTMNKSVHIKASASETHYVCIASRIPGSNDQRTATVMVKSLRPTDTESTITTPQRLHTSYSATGVRIDMPNDKRAAKIAVPITVIMVFIVGIGLVMFFAFRRRRRHTGSGGATKIGSDEEVPMLREKAKLSGSGGATKIGSDEEVPMLREKAKLSGHVSFYELWSLAYETREVEKVKIHQALIKLSIKDVTEGLTPANTYDLLCKWKEEHKTDDLAEILREALESADLESRWIQLCEQRKRIDSKVSQETLEQIIREIENPEQIQEFLGELIPNRQGDMDVKGKGKDIIEEAMRVTQEWGKGPFEENPFASLSLALESSGCSPLDWIFFDGDTSIPSRHLKQDEPMSHEMKKFQKELKDTYCRKYSMIKTSPLDPESEKRLQQIYIKLELILDDEKKGKRKKPLEYDELFELIRTETGSGSKTRFAFIGEAGVGKSTLLARIAFDWATGKCLQEIDLLFLLPLREVMETKYFGDIALNYVSDDIELEGKEVDGFIRYHQRQVLFLFDGLDESKLHLKSPDCDNATASILRGDRFRKSAVIVTTRPSHVEQIKINENIHKQYTFVQVEGFTRENMAEYVRRFFEDDTDSSSSLIEVMNTNEVIAEHMAPYPIFCSMLCHLWKSESKREKMQKLRTYSQIMKEMVFSLQEQYSSKYSDYENNVKRTDEAMAKIGSVAFQGLLIKQLVFKKDKITSVIEDATIACKLGILSKESKLLPREIRQREKKQFADEFRFPHKLMQEFMAGQYLSSLYNIHLSEFQRVLREKLLRSKEDFRYVLYFTAAHGGAVGSSIMEALCHVHPGPHYWDNRNFIMEVAFECQDMEAIDHVANLVRRESELNLSVGFLSHHAISGYLLTLERCGQRAIRTSSTPLNLDSPSNASAPSSSPYTAAIGLFTLEKLRELKLRAGLDDDFYTGMSAYASKSQIERWNHSYSSLGPSASQQYARGLFSMPELTSLDLDGVKLDDEFYSAMVQVSPQSKIERWKHSYSTLGPSASQQYARGLFSMPELRSLKLYEVKLGDEFFSAMVQVSPQSKIERWKYSYSTLGPSASQQYARGLFSMPELTSLDLDGLKLDDEFYSAMVQVSPQSKIGDWSHTGASLGPSASQQYATGLFSMPELTSLNLDRVELDDEFFSAMVQVSPQSKIGDWNHTGASLGPSASQQYVTGLFSMPELTSLNLDGVELDDEFFSAMVQVSPQSKIQELELDGLTMTRHTLHTFLSLPCLQSLDMGRDITCTETDNGDTSVESSHGSSVDKLSVYSASVGDLWKLGLHTSCPRVNTLTIDVYYDVLSSDIVSMACAPFPHLTVLHIRRASVDPVSFCDAVMSSCLRLNTLTFQVVNLSNKMATEIIQSMKTHPQLKTLQFDRCETNEALDPLIAEINKEGNLTVIATHRGI